MKLVTGSILILSGTLAMCVGCIMGPPNGGAPFLYGAFWTIVGVAYLIKGAEKRTFDEAEEHEQSDAIDEDKESLPDRQSD